jgi:NAD(P)-dependent dehydrogenase (short-subunit alcohol dehydrogenase family)
MASTPIDFTKPLDPSILKSKTALVTGGASGIGLTLALALHAAGANVTIADVNVSAANHAVSHLQSSDNPISCVECDVTSWESQKQAFNVAAQDSSAEPKTVDIVVSAAGIRTQIAYVPPPAPGSEPQKPPTGTLDVNLTGTYFTAALAGHYFALSPPDPAKQMLFVSSMAAYSQSRSPALTADYTASKTGVRGLFHQYRRPELEERFGAARWNCLAPFFIRTPMISEAEVERFELAGWKVGTLGDVRVAGMRCLADAGVRGRCVVVCKGDGEKGDRVFDACDDLEDGMGVREIVGRRSWFRVDG